MICLWELLKTFKKEDVDQYLLERRQERINHTIKCNKMLKGFAKKDE